MDGRTQKQDNDSGNNDTIELLAKKRGVTCPILNPSFGSIFAHANSKLTRAWVNYPCFFMENVLKRSW